MSKRSRRWFEFANSGNAAGPVIVYLGLFTGGSVLTYAPAAGTLNNVNPGGAWPSVTIGRLDVDTTAGDTVWTGLVASAQDGYGVLITNTGANLLTLAHANAGSLAANQFNCSSDLILPTNARTMAVYFGGAINLWFIG